MKSGEITGKRIKSVSNFISKEGMNCSNARLLPSDSVVIALNGRGKTRGTTAILDFECSCNQSVVCISPNSKEELNTEFLHYYLSYLYEFIRNLTGDNDRSGLSMAKIRQIPLMIPKIMEQIEIGNALQGLDNKIEILENKKQILTALFKTLLHELMTGQRRVHEVEFAFL
ncbi:MAG: hypothetical protein FIB08_13195 [Candidatus Methanoperedens sp.]|nr:hypothetical protein [Candidatus Methanoperedens sp.]